MPFNHPGRMARLRGRMTGAGLDAILISRPEDVYYLSGFTGGESPLLVALDRAFLITDSRYREQAEEELFSSCEPRLRSASSLAVTVSGLIRQARLRWIGFEEDNLSWSTWRRLEEKLPGVRLIPAEDLVTGLRMIKDPEEIALIREAGARTVRIFSRFRRRISAGTAEEKLARRLSAAFFPSGGEPAFEPIVAAGAHSSQPHAVSSSRPLRSGEICLIDLGGRWNFYNSDMTRTLVGGKYPPRFKTIYRAVLAAQEAAIRSVRPGVRASDLDRRAREVLGEKGYGEHFNHGLGHGVGLEVHERPRINRRSRDKLQEGMVLTVEPGVYLPGWGGIRVEDTVLVTADGCEVLTPAPKTLESCLGEW